MGPRKYFRTFSVIRSKEIRRKQRNPISRTKEDEGLEYLLEHNTHCKDQEFRHAWYSFQSMTSLNEQPEQAFLKTENISEPLFSCSRILRYRCFARKPISVLLFAPVFDSSYQTRSAIRLPRGKTRETGLISQLNQRCLFFNIETHLPKWRLKLHLAPKTPNRKKGKEKKLNSPVGR